MYLRVFCHTAAKIKQKIHGQYLTIKFVSGEVVRSPFHDCFLQQRVYLVSVKTAKHSSRYKNLSVKSLPSLYTEDIRVAHKTDIKGMLALQSWLS